MIILIQDRQDNFHLVDFTAYNGRKYALCGVVYMKTDIINTLALDDSVRNICRKCKETYDKTYGSKSPTFARLSKSQVQVNLVAQFSEREHGFGSIEQKYWHLEDKYWNKLERYVRKSSRK